MANLDGNLWEFNMARVVIVDVTDDYRLMQPPLPSSFYPVLEEIWLPLHNLERNLARKSLLTGYLYDWHEGPGEDTEAWYVGVVDATYGDHILDRGYRAAVASNA